MTETIVRGFTGRLKDVMLTHENNGGDVVTVIDWREEMARFTPEYAVNPTYEIFLESLQANAQVKGLIKTPFPPITDDMDEVEQRLVFEKHKQKYNPEQKYSVELSLWGQRRGHTGWVFLSSEYIFNNSLIFYLPLLYPYLISEQISAEDPEYMLGISVARGELPDGSWITIRGAYRGTAYYELTNKPKELEENSGSETVGTSTVQLIPGNAERKMLYVANVGNSDLFFMFTWQSSALIAGGAPFLKPGGVLTLTFKDINYDGGNNLFFFQEAVQYYIRYPMYVIRKNGIGSVAWQEFY